MTDSFLLIKHYLEMLEAQFDIIIYDNYKILENTELASLSALGKWHTNDYCLKIKSDWSLHKKCVRLNRCFGGIGQNAEGVIKSTCFCGVTEYLAPIKIDNREVCSVAATGFNGELREGIAKRICKRLSTDKDELINLKNHALITPEREDFVIYALEILADLISRYITEKIDLSLFTQPKTNEYVIKAIEFISTNFSLDITALEVADYCHISVAYLQRLFCEVKGHGIAEEIRNSRLNYAKELLCTTEYSVKYIAFQCGYNSADYFCTTFKKYLGISPLKFRKKFKK